MNINELIKKYSAEDIDNQTKIKRILILNAKIKKDSIDKEINELIDNFVIEFNQSDLDYDYEKNLNHMLILLKGDILYSDFCKKFNFNNGKFSINDLEKKIYKEEIETGYNYDELKNDIKLYNILITIDEKNKNLREELLSVLNKIVNGEYNEDQLSLMKNKIFELYKNNVLDKVTYLYSIEFINYLNSKIYL